MIKEIKSLSNIQDSLVLISKVFEEYQAPEYSEVGIKNFYRLIDQKNIQNLMKQKRIILYGYFEKEQLIGVIAINKPDHICLLFVDKKHHKQGIAKKLYNYWIKHNHTHIEEITVNSSSYAVEFYQKLGFSFVNETEEITEKDGIKYHPMVLELGEKESVV